LRRHDGDPNPALQAAHLGRQRSVPGVPPGPLDGVRARLRRRRDALVAGARPGRGVGARLARPVRRVRVDVAGLRVHERRPHGVRGHRARHLGGGPGLRHPRGRALSLGRRRGHRVRRLPARLPHGASPDSGAPPLRQLRLQERREGARLERGADAMLTAPRLSSDPRRTRVTAWTRVTTWTRTSSALASGVLAGAFALGSCGGSRGEGALEPGGPQPSEAEWEQLRGLALTEVVVPEDPTNAFADDPQAIAWGHRLFFYPGFSGPLLDSDNDGGPGSLGARGETGRVACSGCHIPEAGFVDTRSRGQQISLAARWTERRTPSLLDVAQKKLFTWVGKADTLHGQVFTVLENDREMNTSRLFVAQEVFRTFRADYEALFGPLPPLDDAERFP